MFRHLSAIFLQGLIATLPLIVTVWLLGLLVWWAEVTVRQVLLLMMPEWVYKPGMGMAAAIILIFCIGLLLNAYLVKRVYEFAERFMQRIPVVKSVYGAVKDFLQYFAGAQQKQMNQVVLVRLPHSGCKVIGLVTRQSFSDLPKGLGDEQTVAVYTPMSYMIGGYTLIIPRSQVEPIDMSIEDALRFALTAGVTVREPASTASTATNTAPTTNTTSPVLTAPPPDQSDETRDTPAKDRENPTNPHEPAPPDEHRDQP